MECELTKYCQIKTGKTDFFPWFFRAIHGGVLMRGAVCPLITRGKRKGQPNFKKMDKDSIQEIFMPASNIGE